jgi:integrase/recombinase XerD
MEIQSLLDKFKSELKLAGKSLKTIECYISFANKFLVYFDEKCNPKQINLDEVKAYQIEIGEDHPCQFKQSLATLKFFYGKVVGQPHKLDSIKYRKWNAKLPDIIDKSILIPKLEVIKDLKYQALFTLIYGTGIRLNEACSLKIEDFNKGRKVLIIREGKGGKDRVIPTPESMLIILRKYYVKYNRPTPWLFVGENPDNYISGSTVERKCRELLDAHPHQLRHSFAVAYLEAGGDIYVLSKILGHEDIHTTERYLRLTNKMLTMIKSPIDEMKS